MSTGAVQIDEQQFRLIAKALADPSRFEILKKIGQGEGPQTCTCLREWTKLAPATISHHLKELTDAGLIQVERSGKFAHITLRRDVWDAYLKRLSSL